MPGKTVKAPSAPSSARAVGSYCRDRKRSKECAMSSHNEKHTSSAPSSSADDGRSASTATDLNWAKAAQTALGSALFAGLLGGAFYVIGKVIESDMRVSRERTANTEATTFTPYAYADYAVEDDDYDQYDEPDSDGVDNESADTARPFIDEKVAQAAALLEVSPTATEDQVRAALRARLSSSRLHPDHGGDCEQAKRLIAAKNLLIEHARTLRT